jgi:alpha-D-ribose 1-methylphosphonate 5-triphosphate synthase subunit PhnL
MKGSLMLSNPSTAEAVTVPKGSFGCNQCGRRWFGLSEGHCTVCHTNFSSDKSFDLHRVGEYEPDTRRCLTEKEMHALTNNNGRKLLDVRERSLGNTWVTI